MRNCLKLFSSCFITKGHSRGVVIDIQRNNVQYVPNSLCEILLKYDGKTLDHIKKEYAYQQDEIIDEYYDFLLENEYVFYCYDEEVNLFPQIDITWQQNAIISNCIIEFGADLTHINDSFILQLEKIGCLNIQLRNYEPLSYNILNELLCRFNNSNIESIEVITNLENETKDESEKLLITYSILHQLVIHSSLIEEKYSFLGRSKKLLYTKEFIDSNKLCGKVDKKVIDLDFYNESLHFNTCLNRKICIDANGNIKNCPSMQKSFGNIKNTTLEEAINKPEFKDLWGIRKDDIDVCKDCEFRYMCTDCRCFIKDSSDIYSQPAKCGYNPYIALWKGQEGWISVEQWRAENPNWEKDVVRLIPGKDYYKN